MPSYECPTCARVFTVERREDAPFRPFCCERCKMVDLGRWLDGSYTISEPLRGADRDDDDLQDLRPDEQN
jgi:endogenous inhibitor of DNA gyrase (YacG/DUF329 family)